MSGLLLKCQARVVSRGRRSMLLIAAASEAQMTIEPVVSRSVEPRLVLAEDIKDLRRLMDATSDVRLEAEKLLGPPGSDPSSATGGIDDDTASSRHASPSVHIDSLTPPAEMHHHSDSQSADLFSVLGSDLPSTAELKPPEGQMPLQLKVEETAMLFGVNNFGLTAPFCNPGGTNNNHETVNHNHTHAKNGRILAADRKRPYPCNICPSRFGSKMELEEHQNSHTGMKPFECDVCKARFNRRSTLWNHKRIHSDAKPFVCTVCQMTFKWKNSLKCHKEMHLRKNESSTVLDNDLRQLTYATAAKKRLLQMMNDGQPDGTPTTATTIHSQPLITTAAPKKKKSTGIMSKNQSGGLDTKAWLTQHLLPTADHPLDLDTSSLDTLVQQSNQNLLVHLCNAEVDVSRNANLLGNMEEQQAMLNNPLFVDMKPDVNLLQNQDFQLNYHNNLLNTSMSSSTSLNMHLPLNLMNLPRINGLNSPQQLPSVHHLSSAAMASGNGVSVLDYQLGQESIQNSVQHQPYVVSQPSDLMLSQQSLSYPQQSFQMEPCVIPGLTTGQDYVGDFHYNMLNQQYTLADSDSSMGHQSNGPSMQPDDMVEDQKVLPFDQW